MILDLKQLFDVVGDRKEIDYSLDLSEDLLSQTHPLPHPVQVIGEVVNRAGIVTLTLRVRTVLELICDRCLDEFSLDYDKEFSHVLVQKLNGPNDDYIVAEDSRLDLDDLVRTDILLSLPSKILCKEDCQGLCSHCGANRNRTSCECDQLS